jgi:hypothetical protein
MKALYILGTGSGWANNEMRYSLRSLQECTEVSEVVVVGSTPPWLKTAHHIPCRDMGRNKLRNTIEKLRVACESGYLDEPFLRMNDDFFFNHRHTSFPLYAKRRLKDTVNRDKGKEGYYYKATRNTLTMLVDHGISNPYDFSIHFPLVMESEKVLNVMRTFPPEEHGAYLFGTVYANIYNSTKPIIRPDFKVWAWKDEFSLSSFISTDNGAVMQTSFREWIAARFPNPSRYER